MMLFGEAPGPRGADQSEIPFWGDGAGITVYRALAATDKGKLGAEAQYLVGDCLLGSALRESQMSLLSGVWGDADHTMLACTHTAIAILEAVANVRREQSGRRRRRQRQAEGKGGAVLGWFS